MIFDQAYKEHMASILKDMGYDYISCNDITGEITYRCSHCGAVGCASVAVISNEYIKHRWRLCSSCHCVNPDYVEPMMDNCKKSNRLPGSTQHLSISAKRDNAFKEWQSSVTEINDDIIKEKFKYDKFVELIDNPVIIEYLEKRFDDSDSLLESVQRIKHGVEHKPICANPNCNNPVKWNGHPSKLYYRYCCTTCSNSCKETQEKAKQTNIRKYGSPSYVTSDASKQRCMEEYGTPYMFQSKDVINKMNESKFKKFGTIYPMQNEKVKEKTRNTFMDRYGVPTTLMMPEIRKMAAESLLENGKSGTSRPEREIYDIINQCIHCEVHHFDENIFPFNVDIYIPEYKIFIEYQGSQYHNGRAYFNTAEDISEKQELEDKAIRKESENGKISQYSAILYQWVDLDVRKREIATRDGLNYLEIYSYHDAEDIKRQLSLYLNCLLGIKPIVYSEDVIKEEFEYYKNLHIDDDCTMSGSPIGQKNIIVKNYQFCEFYKTEMWLYANNPVIRRKLIQNRIKYLGKKEHELTVSDIFVGFKKSGLYYGYSHFNPVWTNWFVNKYNIRSVYDPCGGWGHHLLGMLACEKIIYNDFNTAVCDNIRKMKDELCIGNIEIHNEDGREFVPECSVDGWFMCPPYYNVERYNGKSFKDIGDYKEFLNRIFGNWSKSGSMVFGLVIREDFIDLIDYEWSEVYDLNCGEIHYNRSVKKHWEKFYIFKKKEQD